MAATKGPGSAQGRPLPPGAHRTLVYCSDAAVNIYREAYGWWCQDRPATQDADTSPSTKQNAERNAYRHRVRAGSRFTVRKPTPERQPA